MIGLLRPGMRLSRRLTVPGKFAVLAVALLLPTLIGLGAGHASRSGPGTSVERERQGLAYVRPLVRLSVQIGQLRDEITVGGHPEAISLSAIAEVDQVHAELGDPLGVEDDWTRVRTVLLATNERPRTNPGHSAYPVAALQMAAQSTSRLITEIADTSGLTVDGRLDGHYLTVALVTRVPALVEAVSQAQESETARRRGLSPDLESRIAAGILTDRMNRLAQTLDAAWRSTGGTSGGRGAPDLRALRTSVEVFVEAVTAHETGASGTLPTLSVHTLSVTVLDLAESLATDLDRLLGQRVEEAGRTSMVNLTLVTLAALLACYVFAAMFRAMTDDVRSVLSDISTVTSGGIHQTEPLPGSDEFARMSRAVVYARDQLTALVGALRYQATHDELTALGNRTLLTEKLEEVLTVTDEPGPEPPWVGMVIIDLDGFNDVNDSFGQGIGDHLLRTVGARFHKGVRRRDVVARLGGDDFAVLLPDISGEAEAREIVSRLQETLQQPVVVGGRRLRLRVNAGIALGRPGVDGAMELLRNADVAKYTAKELGKGQVAVFEPIMHARTRERAELSADLVAAVEQGELSLLYQPIVDLMSGQVHGAEALVRWQHPTRGDVSPEVFVPLAEATGLIQPIGSWVLRTAAEQLVGWRRDFPDRHPLTLDVNLSAAQLTDDGLVGDILSIIDETGVDPRSLVLEITESALMADVDTALRRLGQLSAIGVRLALDDFGTGYSSLSYLLRLPVSVLKIDKSFVSGIEHRDDHSTALLRSIIGLGASLGMQTVAEGIEDARQEGLLRDAGCHLGQGFRYSRPVPGDAFASLLRSSRPGVPWPRTSSESAPGPVPRRAGPSTSGSPGPTNPPASTSGSPGPASPPASHASPALPSPAGPVGPPAPPSRGAR